MLPETHSNMSERPRCCRNLTSAFDAVSVVEDEPREQSENRENLFVEQLLNSDCEQFKARWGYDPKEDKPVEGSNWEYELIHPVTSSQQQVVAASAEVAVGEDTRRTPSENISNEEETRRAPNEDAQIAEALVEDGSQADELKESAKP